MRSAASAARGATYVFIQGVVSTLLSILYFIVLARSFPPPRPELGVYALLSFIVGLAQIVGTMSLSSASVKYIAQYVAEGHLEKARSVVARVLQMSILISIPLSAFLFVSATWLSMQLLGTPAWAPYFEAIALVSFLVILHAQVGGFLQGLQRMKELAATGIVLTFIQKALVMVLLLMGLGFFGVIYGWMAGLIVSTIMALFLTARYLGISGKPHPIKPLMTFSYPLYLSAILAFAANWVDQLLILPFMGTVYLGMYGSVALPAATIPALISSAFVTVLFPKFSELYSHCGKERLGEAFKFTSRYAMLISFPIITALAILAEPILVLLAGTAWKEAAQPLTILSLVAIPAALGIAIGPMFLTLERTKTASIIAGVSIAFEIVLSYVTLAYLGLGMIGAASSRLITSIITTSLGIYCLRKSVKISLDRDAFWKASVASIAMAVTILALRTTEIAMHQLFLLTLYTTLGLAAYFFSLIVLRAVRKSDVDLLHDYLPRGLKKVAVWVGRVFLIK